VSLEPNKKITARVVAVAALCVLSTGRFASQTAGADSSGGGQISISEYENRFRDVRNILPERGVIGYLSDGGHDETLSYYLTQYALAPVVVDHSLQHPLVVGNFTDRSATRARTWPHDLVVVQDFGNGIVLLRMNRP
jgi:hypothetical protein